jgi:predicted PurR-regulated permease PerM
MESIDNRQKYFRWVLLTISGLACLILFYPFVIEILTASFFGFALSPITKSLSTKKYFHRKGWVAITLLCLIMAVVIPISLLIYNFFTLINDVSSEGFQSSEFYRDLLNTRDVLIQWANSMLTRFNLKGQFDLGAFTNQIFSGVGGKIMSLSTNFASRLPDVGLSLFIFCCALYLFLAEGRKIRYIFTHNHLLPASELDSLIRILQKSCYVTLMASLFIGALQAFVLALGSLILGANHFFLIFLVTFIFSFIPVIGAAPVALVLALMNVVQGHYPTAVGYIIVAVIAGTVDNLIRPWLVTGEENIHPVVMLLAIIGAILVLGLPGLFLGPMFISAAREIYSLYFLEPDPTSAVIKEANQKA